MKCDQKNLFTVPSIDHTFDEPWRGPICFSSKVEEWLMMTFVMENCLLDLFVVLDLESYNNKIQIVFWKTWNLLKWADLK
jgi:hypothetical protein